MLKRKMFRDISKNKIQFISIFIMVFLGSFIFSGIRSEWRGMEDVSSKYYDKTNLVDMKLYGNEVSKENIEKLKKIKEIEQVEKRLTIQGIGELKQNPKMIISFVKENKISQAYTVKGKAFNENIDGIWLDSRFAEANKLRINDVFRFKVNGLIIEKIIQGFIMSPEYVYMTGGGDFIPNHKNIGFAYVSYKEAPQAMQNEYSELLIKTNTNRYGKIEEQITKLLKDNYGTLLKRDEFVSYQMLNEEINQHKAMGTIFPIAFLAIAIISVLTTMIRLLSSQRLQISILKALGFKKYKILKHYLSYGFIISFTGAFLGTLSGPMVIPYLFYPSMKLAYTLPKWQPAFSMSFFILPMLLVFCCTLITFWVCRGYLKETPANGMRQRDRKKIKRSVIEKGKIWTKFGFSLRWNVRDILRNKARSVMVIVGVFGCTGLLICAFGLKDSVKNIADWQFEQNNRYETKIELEDMATSQQISKIANDVEGEKVLEKAIEIRSKNTKKSGVLSVVENNSKLIRFAKKGGEGIHLEKGVALSEKMAELLDVQIGDTIYWHTYGEDTWIESTLMQLYYSPTTQGMAMEQSTFERQGGHFNPNKIVTIKSTTSMQKGVASIWTKEELKAGINAMLETMNLFVYILIAAAVLMATVVLYCLGIISFTEKYKELATLKVLGFKSKKIQFLLIQQNILLTCIAIPIGFMFGHLLISSIVGVMGDSLDLFVVIRPLSYIICTIGTMMVSILVSILFSKRVKTIDMVSALKED